MRTIAAIAFTLLGLAMLAAPASAHRAGKAPTEAPKPVSGAAIDDMPAGVCLFSVDGGRVPEQPRVDDANRKHGEADHDAGDHSHPMGEDPFHQEASHASLDAANHETDASVESVPPAPLNPLHSNERICGIDVIPPAPPPLG